MPNSASTGLRRRAIAMGLGSIMLLIGRTAWAADGDGARVGVSANGAAPAAKPAVRNVILLIGDGMGPQQIGLLTTYARLAPHSTFPDRTAAIERLMIEGVGSLVLNYPHGVLVVDSAAAATQLASGHFSASEMIGSDFRGDRVENIVEAAHRVGKSAGLVTDTRITHATPAGFAAHRANREQENDIADDMLTGRIDVLMGGGLRNWVPQAVNDQQSPAYAATAQMIGSAYPFTSRRTDKRNLLLEGRETYKLAFDRRTLAQVKRGPLLGLFADSELADALREVPTRARNRNYVDGHPYMSGQTVPRIRDFEPFYVYGENLRMNLLGRAMASQQHVTWGAGTHSSTPVILGAFGPPAATQRFHGLLHATEVGQRMIELITQERAQELAAPARANKNQPAASQP